MSDENPNLWDSGIWAWQRATAAKERHNTPRHSDKKSMIR
jgi:hypothetical protein